MSKEEEDDNAKLQWCTNARNTNTEETQRIKDNIDHLETAIDELESDIASVKEIIATSKVNIQELTELMTQTKAVQQSEHAKFEEDIKETQDVVKLLGVAIQILNESREAAGESSLGNAISLLQTRHTNTASEEETLVGPKTLQKPMTGRPPLNKSGASAPRALGNRFAIVPSRRNRASRVSFVKQSIRRRCLRVRDRATI